MQIKKLFTMKKILIATVIILVGGGIGAQIYKSKHNTDNITVETVRKNDLKQTVLATGQVTSSTDINLSFQTSGTVKSINVKTGDKVRVGQALASLDQKNQIAALTQARGAAASAQAAYEKLLAGVTSQDAEVSKAAVASAKVTLENARATYAAAKSQQQVAVDNAYSALLNSSLTANRDSYFDSTFTATISGTYANAQTGEYKILLTSTGVGSFFYHVTGLESDSRQITRGVPMPLGTRGLFVTFSTTGTMSEIDKWTVPVPNTQASTYITNYNAWLAAKETQNQTLTTAQNTVNAAQTALDQAQASLDLKLAIARPEDVAAARATILSAQGQVQSAEAALQNTVIIAPSSGTITNVDVKLGELASAQKAVIVLQDVDNLHIEANISEANIASLKSGQEVDVTYDALGPDRHFQSRIEAIDPASTVVSGVVNYKVTSSVTVSPEIRPGLTANLTILTNAKTGVLSVPQRAVLMKNDGTKTVRVIQDRKTKTFKEVPVTLGLSADGGLVEILSGLTEGEEIVSFIKTQ